MYVLSDNASVEEYTAELENDDFTVGAYTVALHTSNINQWPSVLYNDIVVVPANVSRSMPIPRTCTINQFITLLADAAGFPHGRECQVVASPPHRHQRCTTYHIDEHLSSNPTHHDRLLRKDSGWSSSIRHSD